MKGRKKESKHVRLWNIFTASWHATQTTCRVRSALSVHTINVDKQTGARYADQCGQQVLAGAGSAGNERNEIPHFCTVAILQSLYTLK